MNIYIADLSSNEIMFNIESDTASASHQCSNHTTTKFRWTNDSDGTLMKEVAIKEPDKTKTFSKERKQTWEIIASNVNVMVNGKLTSRACNERYEKLKKNYKTKRGAEERASGIAPDEPTECEKLLNDLMERGRRRGNEKYRARK